MIPGWKKWPTVAPLLGAACLMLYPKPRGSFGGIALEAFALGVPTVTSPVVAVPGLLNGHLFVTDFRDIGEVCAGILQELKGDRQLGVGGVGEEFRSSTPGAEPRVCLRPRECEAENLRIPTLSEQVPELFQLYLETLLWA